MPLDLAFISFAHKRRCGKSRDFLVVVGRGQIFKVTREKERAGNKKERGEKRTKREGEGKGFPLRLSLSLSLSLTRAHSLPVSHSHIFPLLLLAQHVGDLLALGLAARVRAQLLLREPEGALLAARLEQLADPALVGGEPRDLTDDLADDLDALGAALLRELAEGGVRRRRR